MYKHGCNVQCIGNNKVIAIKKNKHINDKMRALGIDVIDVPFDQILHVCARYTLIDSKDYELDGISSVYRGYLSHLVTHQVTNRIDAHIERINCHPMEIRRYYRQLKY